MAQQSRFVLKNNEFAFKLFNEIYQRAPKQNFVFSPHSIYSSYAALSLSADEKTEAAILKALGVSDLENPKDKQRPEFFGGLKNAASAAGVSSSDFKIFWLNRDAKFSPNIREKLKLNFDITSAQTDFGNPRQAATSMNAAVEKASWNAIKNSVAPSHIDNDSMLVVQCANSFGGKLELGFGVSNTSKGDFTGADGKKIAVDMMHSESVEFNFIIAEGFKAFKLPYAGEKMSLIIIYPDAGKTPLSALSRMNARHFGQMLDHLKAPTCMSTGFDIPRFAVNTPPLKMNAFLEKVGLGAPFAADADWTKLSPDLKGKPLNALLSKSAFSLKENAKVVDEVKSRSGLFGIPLRNHKIENPFAFLVVDNSTNAIYLMGYVANPQ